MQEPSNRIDWLTIGQLVLGIIGCLISFLTAIILVLLGGRAIASGLYPAQDYTAVFLLAGLALLVGVLNIPSIVLSVQQLRGKIPEGKTGVSSYTLAAFSMFALPLVLIGGHLVSQSSLAWLLLPLFNVLALVIPIWWLVEIGRRYLPSGSPQRSWGLISVSLTITPLLILLTEIVIMAAVMMVVLMLLSSQPLWMEKFRHLIIQFNQSDIDLQFLQTFFQDLLSNPTAVIALILTIGGVMPLLEELLKPLALWILRKRVLTPGEGFSAGLICGAGFAMIESAALVAGTGGADWLQTIGLRITTSLLHITTSGLVGWGLVSTWSQKKNKHFFIALLGAAFLHGLWNTLAILILILPDLTGTSGINDPFQGFTLAGLGIMAAILIVLIVVLFGMNRRLRKEVQINPAAPEPPSLV